MAARAATDYYRILGVARDADAEAIRRAYRALARVTHTDAAEIPPGLFDLVTEARDVLLDPHRRGDYDRALAAGSQPRPGEPPPATASGPASTAPGPRPAPTGGDRPAVDEQAPAYPGDGSRGPGVLGQLRGLDVGRGLRWAFAMGALAAALTALRIFLLPVPAGLPFAPSAALGPGGGAAGRVALSAVGAAVVAPWAAVWWSEGRRRPELAAALAGAVAVLALAEFVCAAAVMSVLALVGLWLIRTAWRAFLWVYGAP